MRRGCITNLKLEVYLRGDILRRGNLMIYNKEAMKDSLSSSKAQLTKIVILLGTRF